MRCNRISFEQAISKQQYEWLFPTGPQGKPCFFFGNSTRSLLQFTGSALKIWSINQCAGSRSGPPRDNTLPQMLVSSSPYACQHLSPHLRPTAQPPSPPLPLHQLSCPTAIPHHGQSEKVSFPVAWSHFVPHTDWILSCLNPFLRCPWCSTSQGSTFWAPLSFWMKERNLHLEVLDGGGLASFFQGLVYPADYNVIISFLTITQVLEDIQRVPENQQREQGYAQSLGKAVVSMQPGCHVSPWQLGKASHSLSSVLFFF